MKSNIMNQFLVLTVVLGFATHASASLEEGPINLTQGGDFYLGYINDGIPSSPAHEASYINNLITLADEQGNTVIGSETYNRLGSTVAGPFPDANTTMALKDESDGVTSITLANIYTYIVGKYDAGQAGSLVWYFPMGVTGQVIPQSTLNGLGLSHISAYNFAPIPEPASLLVWGGLALVSTYVARRRMC